ncbi:hypothetical protein O6H91_09G075900 [Diphasiastrum complanatum]|uniref:Uncharacterized protein n=1 Tax=Diphasiastrum complanatum TaxID=34168 RepID=A0ACC2CR32_DIPCM|nr:hypothetical protein O6H91_09G075900 [Diphasiastrum complanatum]
MKRICVGGNGCCGPVNSLIGWIQKNLFCFHVVECDLPWVPFRFPVSFRSSCRVHSQDGCGCEHLSLLMVELSKVKEGVEQPASKKNQTSHRSYSLQDGCFL